MRKTTTTTTTYVAGISKVRHSASRKICEYRMLVRLHLPISAFQEQVILSHVNDTHHLNNFRFLDHGY